MIKAIPQDGWDFPMLPAAIIKAAATGLGRYTSDFSGLTKRAGYIFADQVRKLDLKPGDVPVHLIAMGSTEKIGINRNGDGFPDFALDKYHPTFVKLARCYRNHQNKDPNRSYGFVKFSAYRPAVGLVDLLVIYNGTKEAADRNHGLVAEDELEKLSSDKPLAVSMSCKIPMDRCSHCQHWARNRGEYCDDEKFGGQCKAGGLKHNMGKYVGGDEPILHAVNDKDVSFFDISNVGKGADRTAYALGVIPSLTKTSIATHTPLGGAALAEMWGMSEPAYLPASALESLQGAASRIKASMVKLSQERGYLQALLAALAGAAVTPPGGRAAAQLVALQDAKVAAPLGLLAQLYDAPLPEVRSALPEAIRKSAFTDLILAQPCVRAVLNPASVVPTAVDRHWAGQVARTHSVLPDAVEKRAAFYFATPLPPTFTPPRPVLPSARSAQAAAEIWAIKCAAWANWSAQAPKLGEFFSEILASQTLSDLVNS
jgi:hypothetical protein